MLEALSKCQADAEDSAHLTNRKIPEVSACVLCLNLQSVLSTPRPRNVRRRNYASYETSVVRFFCMTINLYLPPPATVYFRSLPFAEAALCVRVGGRGEGGVRRHCWRILRVAPNQFRTVHSLHVDVKYACVKTPSYSVSILPCFEPSTPNQNSHWASQPYMLVLKEKRF